MSRPQDRQRTTPRLRITLLLSGLALLGGFFTPVALGQAQDQISMAGFKRVIADFLARHDLPRNEIITLRDVTPLLSSLEAHGMILNRKELSRMIPDDQSSLVRLLRTPNGQKFSGQTSGNRLMFDRLDRLANEPGGERMLRDLMKLPNAARYAKLDTGPGVPDLIDFLPKMRSSKTRRVKDYSKPTGKLYTLEAVIDYLAKQVGSSPRRGKS